jgi:hypothetical protein
MQVLGDKIGAEGYEQADEDLGAAFFAIMTRNPTLRARHGPGYAGTDRDAAKGDPKEIERSVLDRECAR